MEAKSRARKASYGLDPGRARLLAVALGFLAAMALACSSSTASPTPPARRAPAEAPALGVPATALPVQPARRAPAEAPALEASATALPVQPTSRDSVATGVSPAAGEDPIPPIVRQLNPSGPKVVARRDFRQLLRRDGINPVYSPVVVELEMAALDSDDLVIGVSMGGESRAYPIRPLRFREMVNDELGGTPILVTW